MKELQLILIAGFIALFLGLGLYYITDAPSRSTEVNVGFTTVETGIHGPTEQEEVLFQRRNYVLHTEEELERLFGYLYPDGERELPEVDFTTEQVIAVLQGVQPTGGYDIRIDHITDTSQVRQVHITLTNPGPRCITSQAQTNPYHIVIVPKTTKPLNSVETVATTRCDL